MQNKIEFIDEYVRVGSDWQYNDNRGELIRCKNCKHFCRLDYERGECYNFGFGINNEHIIVGCNWYCADGQKKGDL